MSKRSPCTTSLSAWAFTACAALALSSAYAADFPTGKYAAKELGIVLVFDEKGQFHVNKGETMEVTGNYAVKAGEINLTDTQGPWACTKAGEQMGTYDWKYEDAVLSLSKVADKCEDRVRSLINVSWKRQK